MVLCVLVVGSHRHMREQGYQNLLHFLQSVFPSSSLERVISGTHLREDVKDDPRMSTDHFAECKDFLYLKPVVHTNIDNQSKSLIVKNMFIEKCLYPFKNSQLVRQP